MAERSRLQKILAQAGVASRRKAEQMILDGRVTVNGRPARLGDSALPGRDSIALDGQRLDFSSGKIYLALHKPRGFVTTMEDERGRKCVAQLVEAVPGRVYPVGRLDKDSEGLLLLTNDGDLIEAVMRGLHRHEKEYTVKVNREIEPQFLEKMAAGIYLRELKQTTRPCEIRQTGKYTFQIILTQGLNRQIRRMCQACGYEVRQLKRVRVMNIELEDLAPGKYREVQGRELERLYRDAGVPLSGENGQRG